MEYFFFGERVFGFGQVGSFFPDHKGRGQRREEQRPEKAEYRSFLNWLAVLELQDQYDVVLI